MEEFLDLTRAVEGIIQLNRFESEAPALTESELEEWRWLQHPPGLSLQQQRRAECDAQPTLADGLRSPHGRCRRRPNIRIGSDREANDFDALLDKRAFSPNGRPQGYWDWNKDEIERENSFTPESVEEPLGPPRNEREDIARRLLALSPLLRLTVIDLAGSPNVESLRDALVEVEGHGWWYELVPSQRVVVQQARSVLDITREALIDEITRGEDLSVAFREVMCVWSLRLNDNNHPLHNYLGLFIAIGQERAWFMHEYVYDVIFWYFAVVHIENFDGPSLGRQLAVQKVMAMKRIKNFRRMVNHMERWLEIVTTGNRELQIWGVEGCGNFWQDGRGFEDWYWRAVDAYGVLEEDAAIWMSTEDLRMFVAEGQIDEDPDRE